MIKAFTYKFLIKVANLFKPKGKRIERHHCCYSGLVSELIDLRTTKHVAAYHKYMDTVHGTSCECYACKAFP